jgi:hypothetical protein
VVLADLSPCCGAHALLLLRMPWNERVWVPAVALTGLALGDSLIIFGVLILVARLVGGTAALKEFGN